MSNEKQLKKLLAHAENKDLALFDEVQLTNDKLDDISATLKSIEGKEQLMPEIPEADFTATNALLQRLLDKENEQCDTIIELNLI